MPRPATLGFLLSVSWCAASVVTGAGGGVPDGSEARVRAAALEVYVHGMTAAIADREIGVAGVGELLRLLDDPTFPRRDNVVAFLAYLGGSESTAALVPMLERPASAATSIEDARASLLVPHALGHIAARGDRAALDALLSITEENAAVARPGVSPGLREAAIHGLAIAGTVAARERLAAIADGRTVPDPQHPELASRARAALVSTYEAPPASAVEPAGSVDYAPDPARQSHHHGLTFANHAGMTNPMTTARLDGVLQDGTRRAATSDFDGDVPCCTSVSRSGSAGAFGTAGDGLDAINDAAGLTAVLGQSSGRVKVVKVINYCGGSGTNIIGCSYAPGKGVVLVRLSSIAYEAVLWLHEYGHNLGLGHSLDPAAIMAPSDNGANNRLALPECFVFHAPPGSASAILTVAGTCTDDGDLLADPIDNCPFVANETQADADGNGVGDACDTGLNFADFNLSGRVDGFDLARLGRAFGAASGDPRFDAAADLDHDAQVDGTDLALFAAQFGR